jgi:pimeloyl-ACP methyl ester carboxylesterase
MTAHDRDIRTSTGRTLRVREDGDPHGAPVFVLHGTPASRLLYGPHVDDARRQGIRLIGFDRPGYGGSTRVPGRTVGDAAEDVRAIADDLGIDRFGLWGISGGGAPALACAARLPGRAAGVASLAAVAPYPTEGFDWFAGMGEYNIQDFQLMMRDRAAWEAKNERELDEMRKATPAEMMIAYSSLMSDVDRAACTPEFTQYLYDWSLEGLRPGIGGAADDNLSQIRPWGFDLASIRGPVMYWHGEQDRFVPYSHGQWIASRLPQDADIHLSPDEGHLSLLVRHIPEVHTWLLRQLGR